MNTEVPRSKIISVLLFFVFMSFLFVISLYVTGGLEGVIGEKDTIHVAFHDSVTGLRKGSAVTLSGVNVGRVKNIRPMTSSEARNIVRNASVVSHPEHQSNKPGQMITGKQYLSEQNPLVLVTVRVRENAVPLNKKTRVSLITTDFTASQMVRFSAGSKETLNKLTSSPVVFSAGPSPLTKLRSKFLEEQEGVLRSKNLKNINALIENLKHVSQQLSSITGNKTEKKIDKLLASHQNVAARLDQWVWQKPTCPGSNKPVNVEKFKQDGTTKYRYSCPGSNKEWIRNHPPKPGQLTRVVNKMNKLLNRMNHLMKTRKSQPSIPRLMNEVTQLSSSLNQTSRSMTGVIEENRARISALLKNVNQLSNKLDALVTQLEQDPSSAVFGRRGNEIRSPYQR